MSSFLRRSPEKLGMENVPYMHFTQAPTANSLSNGGDDVSDTSSILSFKTQEDGEKDMSNDQNLMDDSEQEESLVSILEDSVHIDVEAISIIKLIRKVKKSSLHATAITRVLSTRFMDIMTHPMATDVILHCLILFPRQPNEVLYEKLILHFHDLAIDKVGCRSLIYCVALIGGDQRVRLLDQIADVSYFLSYDPYGNYVVQNLLGLKNEDVTKKITSRLQNEIMGLAKRRGGCLVVEKCMDNGIITVAMEILDSGRALLRLAGNQFGNYVIEAVLKKTKERGFNSLYNAIVRRLEVGRGGSAGQNKTTQMHTYISEESIDI
ncbi:putative pumilio21 [Sesamum angolense]|uniref:Pumilio21 n=1 Tax=Sesamum angolense TaxID=2727404 RepID=A0AAE1VWB5_9LAMI|nr:putative pumilio21 [Sesamum angolense]